MRSRAGLVVWPIASEAKGCGFRSCTCEFFEIPVRYTSFKENILRKFAQAAKEFNIAFEVSNPHSARVGIQLAKPSHTTAKPVPSSVTLYIVLLDSSNHHRHPSL